MPSFNPFQSVKGKNTAALFEIRLESDLIVLRGAENEASSQMLRGVVVLCLRQQERVEDVHLKMTGVCRLAWTDAKLTATGLSNNKVERVREVFSHKWPLFVGGDGSGSSSKGITLAATNYEWPFELIIPGGTAESIEGLMDSHIVYRLKATVNRGKWAYDLHATKHVRIVRTLDPAALELAHAMTVENIWPNKVEYSLVIPQKAIIFGTSIALEMRFTSLLKGLKIGPIRCQLIEIQEFSLSGLNFNEKYYKTQREVNHWTLELNEEEHYRDVINEEGQDGFVLKKLLPIPKSLRRCLQDCETHGIKIRHKVKFNIALINPDGHVSELRATLPVTIFISPNMPIDEQGNLLDQTPNNSQSPDITTHAPPLYGEHILDQLYADIDTSGYMTPTGNSGMNTPLYNLSREGSAENVSSMDGIASSGIPRNGEASNGIVPDALSSRLQNLNSSSRSSSFFRRHHSNHHGSGGNTPHNEDNLHHGHGSSSSLRFSNRQRAGSDHSPPRSNPLSRRASDEDHSGMTSGRHSPEHIDFSDLGELNKVPSYQTAIHAPMRGLSYSDVADLPNYETAISAPPSPVLGNSGVVHDSDPEIDDINGGGSLSTSPDLEMANGHSRHGNQVAGMVLTPIDRSQARGRTR